MVKVEASTTVNRPIQEVFAYMNEPKNWPEWNSLILEAKSDGPVRLGSKIQSVAKFLGRRIQSTGDVTEFEAGRKVTTKSSSPFPLTITTLFEPAAGGTRVTQILEGEPGGFFKLGEPILARIGKKQFEAQLETLKEVLEAQVPART